METTAESVIAKHSMNTCLSSIDLLTDEGIVSYTAMKNSTFKTSTAALSAPN